MITRTLQVRVLSAVVPALVLGLAISLPGCTKAPAQAQSDDKRIKVDVSLPIAQKVTEYEDFTGRVEAADKVLIQAMVGGYLVKQNFVDGEEVTKGQCLFEIDPKIYQAKWDAAIAAKEKADADVVEKEALYLLNKPLEGKSVSHEQIIAMEGSYLKAKAMVNQAVAEAKMAKDNLDYTKVLSPIHGKVSRRMIDVGNMVEAQKTQLTYVYAIDPMYGYFDVDERTVIQIRKLVNKGEMPYYRHNRIYVKVGLADEKVDAADETASQTEDDGFSLRGYIDYVDQVLDAGTGTLKIRCVIRQPRTKESVPHPLFPFGIVRVPLPVGKAQVLVSPGMFIRVRLPIGIPASKLLIAERAVGTEQGKKFINIVGADNKVNRLYVELGQLHYGLRVVKPVNGKLLPTDKVVVSNLQRVGPGKEVVATPVTMPQYRPQDVVVASGAK